MSLLEGRGLFGRCSIVEGGIGTKIFESYVPLLTEYHIILNMGFRAMESDDCAPRSQKPQANRSLPSFKLSLLFNHSNTKLISTENCYQEMRLLLCPSQPDDSETFSPELWNKFGKF